MLPGYNHNVKYKDRLFHIQTEDSGVTNPHIITLLYEGGNILARKKTSYEDVLKSDKLQTVVKEMMQEQHKTMLRELKNGSYDEQLFGPRPAAAQPPPEQARPAPEAAPGTQATPQQQPAPAQPPQPQQPRAGSGETKVIELREGEDLKDEDIFGSDLISDKSLDEVILNYLAQNIEEE